ncbi:MAG: murein biosynthesis integral membrane protein MurJ [Myxococcales bacterium]|nr:murein biosynthesis integral membrane protein MurJ [Myxococcales bacterium]
MSSVPVSEPPADPAPAAGPRVHFVRAFLSSALATGLSRVLGAAREVSVAAFLGVGEASDAFNLAWTIPNAFRRFVADEGLTGAMIPALARAEAEGGEGELRRLGATTFGALLLANVVLVGAGVIGAPWLVLLFAPTWREDPEHLAQAVSMTRLMFPFVGMVSIVSFYEGLLNYRGHFFVPKFAPAVISMGVISAALFFGDFFAEPVYALVWGTLIGAALHVLIHLIPLGLYWGRVGLGWDPSSPRVRAIAIEMSKVIAIGLFAQVNLLVLQQLATSLPRGSLTIYRNSTQLTDLAQGIVAVAIGSALLPNISVSVSTKDWARFRAELARALRLAAFLLIPAAVVLFAFGTPVTAMLFRLGKYTWEDVQRTSAALQFLSPFVLGVAGTNILKKVYFALEDRGTLLKVGAFGVALTGGIGWTLIGWMEVRGLALALSISTVLQLSAYLFLLWRRLGADLGLGGLVGPMARIAVACVPFGLALALFAGLGDWERGPESVENWLVAGGGFAVSAVVYALAAWLVGVQEVSAVIGLVRRRLGR